MKQNITLSYSINRSFVKSDIYIFEALGYNVQRILSRPHKSTIYFIWNRTKELLKSLLYIPSSKIVVSWFNDYHALIPIIISKIFFKKSVIIVGGYDAIVDDENKHGVFYKHNIRSKIARLNYNLASEIWVVHKSLIKGCDKAASKFNVISGVENFIQNKPLKIKEINTEDNTIELKDTIFYGKSGGQPGDIGEIIADGQKIEVNNLSLIHI